MAIIFDTPAVWNPKFGLSAHLISTLYGFEGSQELRRFAAKLGLKKEWLQKPGHPVHEHYDLKGEKKIAKALELGAKQVSRAELVGVFNQKRATLQANQEAAAKAALSLVPEPV